jgi:hypothetical protein
MPRFFFHIRNGHPFNDIDGLELADMQAVQAEAVGLARDLMRIEKTQRDWSKWDILVTDENGGIVLQLPLADVAP